ncbi:Uncharacterized protein OBRU01_17132 [Operophtera brumata]|uniref:ABC transmembrane type-1 domain-containing protein n=1 Tax=Operophtera brumata TaxID=104452 RepID=A0A0L7L1F3_OPEBR|nr:Uncharacterized protein OBRU01_17132 [Operophtera brumata]
MGVKTENMKETKNPKVPPQKKDVPGVFSRSIFWWMFPLFYNGYRRDLEEYDLVPAKHQYDSKIVGDTLERALIKSFGWSFLPGGLLQLIYVSLRTATPLLFGQLLQFWSAESTMPRETAMYYAISMILANWLAAYMNHHGNLYCQHNAALGETTAGKVVNLLSNDLQRFDMAFVFLHFVWIIPLQLTAVCYLGYLQAGYAALIGLAALIDITA